LKGHVLHEAIMVKLQQLGGMAGTATAVRNTP
jgi:hypothetical protein